MEALDASLPGCSTDDFKAVMRRLAASVTILTTWHDGRPMGLTATAITSLAAEPPSLVACVNRTADAYPAIVGSGRLGVNVLSEDQAGIATRFAGATHRGEAKFEGDDWRISPDGAPLLPGAVAAFDCRIEQAMDYGTHTILVCSVRSVLANLELMPLIYLDRTFLAARPFIAA